MDYKKSGVNIEEGYKAVEKYREFTASTASSAVIDGIGGFAGMFSLKEFFKAAEGMEEPVLLAGTDGVGTKIDIALRLKKYDTVGIDCVAMCVNDILCHGARPLFFLDYISCGKLDAAIAAEFVKGVAAGCRETGMVLLGGETAEHPGIIPDDVYDIAGFSVGIADRKNIIDGTKIREGDVLLGIASSGVHSNGFSLIRKIIPDLNENFAGIPGKPGIPIGHVLLEPTRLYVKPVLDLMKQVEIKGMAHITGGGFFENVPRIFPKMHPGTDEASAFNYNAIIQDPLKPGYKGQWKVPAIFERIAAGIKNTDKSLADEAVQKTMFNTYNMGIGFVLALSPQDAKKAAAFLEEKGFPAWEIGHVGNAGKSSIDGKADDNAGISFV